MHLDIRSAGRRCQSAGVLVECKAERRWAQVVELRERYVYRLSVCLAMHDVVGCYPEKNGRATLSGELVIRKRCTHFLSAHCIHLRLSPHGTSSISVECLGACASQRRGEYIPVHPHGYRRTGFRPAARIAPSGELNKLMSHWPACCNAVADADDRRRSTTEYGKTMVNLP